MKYIKILRMQRGLKYSDVAKVTGISAGTIWRIENGYPYQAKTMNKLVEFYDVPEQRLLKEIEFFG